MLSTPTASTKNGKISKMIKVAGTPQNPNNPTDAVTEIKTKMTPVKDKLSLPSMRNFFQLVTLPRANTMYKTINAYEVAIVGMSPEVSFSNSSSIERSELKAMSKIWEMLRVSV